MKQQERIWRHVLTALALYHGLHKPQVYMGCELLARNVQWSKVWNIRHNALIRTTLYTPVRFAQKLTGRLR